jgi:hypothetical protein
MSDEIVQDVETCTQFEILGNSSYARDYAAWLAAGNTPDPYIPPPPPVRYKSKYTIVTDVINLGKLPGVSAVLDSSLELRSLWDAAQEIDVDDPRIAGVLLAGGLTEEEIARVLKV